MGNWYYSFAGLWEKLMNVYFANRSENTANCTADNSSFCKYRLQKVKCNNYVKHKYKFF